MRKKKLLFLFLSLLLPVAIFVFLKIFGRNEFNVPAMHHDGPVTGPPQCSFSYPAPYVIADSISALWQNKPGGASVFVLYFSDALRVPLNRVSEEFAGEPVALVTPAELATFGGDQQLMRECIFLMDAGQSVVLVDDQRRIRGKYVGDDRDEVDRLLVEIKIILKKY